LEGGGTGGKGIPQYETKGFDFSKKECRVKKVLINLTNFK